MSNKYFRLFSNCALVKGAKRSIISDLQYERYIFIPNTLYDILLFNQKNIIEKKALINRFKVNEKGINKYLEYLIENEYGFYTDIPELFPELDFSWDYPALITNCIVDFDINSDYNFIYAFQQINETKCPAIQLRFFGLLPSEKILSIIKEAINNIKCVEVIELVLPYTKHLNKRLLLDNFNKLTNIHYYSSNKNVQVFDKKKTCGINYSQTKIVDENSCGIIDNSNLICNMIFFTEAKNFNTCLNRKLCIDKKGFIKNCPSFSNHFGNINYTSLIPIINEDVFRKYWYICKDKIQTCSDCEFRYMCCDCRVFIKDKTNIYSKPEKCQYDPYNFEIS